MLKYTLTLFIPTKVLSGITSELCRDVLARAAKLRIQLEESIHAGVGRLGCFQLVGSFGAGLESANERALGNLGEGIPRRLMEEKGKEKRRS